MELLVGLVELGGEYRADCKECGRRAALYVVDPVSDGQVFLCTAHAGAEAEAILLRFVE
jgi:hypothetical protein